MNRSLAWMVAASLVIAHETAHAADPTTADCLAASDASLKAGNEHKLRAERGQLLVCAAASCPADIRKDCMSRVEEVNPQIPTIAFAAKDATGADLSAVTVTMDGEVLTERLEGTALSIDPGEHKFTFETAGRAPVSMSLVIQQGQKDRRELVTFGAPTSLAVAVPPPQATVAEPPALTPAGGAVSQGLGTQKILAIVAGGIGLAGLGVGTGFGIVALSKKSSAQGICPTAECPTPAGVNDWSSAVSAGNVSTVGFVLGGVGIAGAAVLWFTAPRSTGASAGAASARVGLGPGGISLKGTW
jgi:hypothetical protein